MSRFVYNANAIALGGYFIRPVKQNIPSLASCVLSNVGGEAAARLDRPYEVKAPDGRLCLSLESAESSIQGGPDNGAYVTEITTVLRGLKVGWAFSIDEVFSRLQVRCSAGVYSFDVTGTRFTGCALQGRAFDVAVDAAMASAASDYAQFRKDHPDIPVSDGKCCYALGRNPELKFQGFDNGYIEIGNFGTIYFAEWEAGPKIQNLNMLRFALGSRQDVRAEGGDDGDEGEIGGGGSGGNGGPLGGS